MFILATIAAGVLTSFLASVLSEVAKYYIGNIWDDDKDIRELRTKLDDQLKLLESKKDSKVVHRIHSGLPPDWLDQLDKCLYDIEDVQSSMNAKDKKKIVAKFLTSYINYVDLICNELGKEAQIKDAGGDSNTQDHGAYELLSSREEYKSKIIEELNSTTNRFGVSIIGMGGIGKTILAKAIAGASSINYFTIMFTPESLHFDLKQALAHIESNMANMPSSVGIKVLILIDGMHWVEAEDWKQFRSQCKEILKQESKVLITTQNRRVADVTGTSTYFLHPLAAKDCFHLILNHANGNGNLCDDDIIAIALNERELVQISKGSALLASQIGILLAAEAPGYRLPKITEITEKTSWEVPGLKRVLERQELLHLLARNPNLIRCLAYCSLFPSDHVFEKEQLVQLWMAEGFTPPSSCASFLESTTARYFDDLLSCSLFQTLASSPGEKLRYKLYELFYDMALNMAPRAFCQKHVGNSISRTPEISSYTRHLSLRCEDVDMVDVESIINGFHKLCSGLRTFLLFRESGKKITKNPTFFRRLTRLRVLDLRHTNLTKLEHKSISELKYLRYLDLSFTPLRDLPKLYKSPELQVLKLNYCDDLLRLPKDLTELTGLVSLQVNARRLARLPSGIGKLTNLRNLAIFIVGEKEGYKIGELGSLNGLRKSLHIKQLENVKTGPEAENAMLAKKVKLERLELEWSTTAENESAAQVLQGLQPPKNLTELMITNYRGAVFPGWLGDSQVCGLLTSIYLKGCKALPSVQQLKLLKTLHLETMDPIDRGTNPSFPFLETLILCDMPHLNDWIQWAAKSLSGLLNLQLENFESLVELPELGSLTALEKLEISSCTMLEKLLKLPPSLKILSINACHNLTRRYQTVDWTEMTGIQVVIDSRSQ